jgi:hypothetical protein
MESLVDFLQFSFSMNIQSKNQDSGYSDLTWGKTIALAIILALPPLLFLVKYFVDKLLSSLHFPLGIPIRYIVISVLICGLNLFTHIAMMSYVEIPILELDILQKKSASFVDAI